MDKCWLLNKLYHQVTGKMRGTKNPFDMGCIRNCCYLFCGPTWPGWVAAMVSTLLLVLEHALVQISVKKNGARAVEMDLHWHLLLLLFFWSHLHKLEFKISSSNLKMFLAAIYFEEHKLQWYYRYSFRYKWLLRISLRINHPTFSDFFSLTSLMTIKSFCHRNHDNHFNINIIIVHQILQDFYNT